MPRFAFLGFAALALTLSSTVSGQVLSPQGQEVRFAYRARFQSSLEQRSAEAAAEFHADHLFGLMKSRKLVKGFGINPNKVEGFGVPRKPLRIQIQQIEEQEGIHTIDYQAAGYLLLHKNAAEELLAKGVLEVPMPFQLDRFYKKQCTDPHYPDYSDFWYFYDPFREGCQMLARAPMAENVEIRIAALPEREFDAPKLRALKGSNGNGNVFAIYVIHGFDESSRDPQDLGRENFESFNAFLEEQGFELEIENAKLTRPLYVFRKQIETERGQSLSIEIRHMLVDTAIEKRSTQFAKFFEEAVEIGDVVYYGGHSGLGGNLDIRWLEKKAGGFDFPKFKQQIFFFDSCSSYSYYYRQYFQKRSRKTLDVITQGLSSTFNVSPLVLQEFIRLLLDPESESLGWEEILTQLESPLDGETFLINVGGI